jgi:hypothetical protein
MRRFTVLTTCPHCDATITATVHPGSPATHLDPPEGPEVLAARGCAHAVALDDLTQEAIFEAGDALEDDRWDRDDDRWDDEEAR